MTPGPWFQSKGPGPGKQTLQALTCSLLSHPAARPHTHRRSARSTCPAPGSGRPASWLGALPDRAGSGLPDVRRLQRIQRRFIKALHGVATCSRFSQANCAPQQLSISSASTWFRKTRRKCRRVPGGRTQRAGAAHCSDANVAGAGVHVAYRPALRGVRPAGGGL